MDLLQLVDLTPFVLAGLDPFQKSSPGLQNIPEVYYEAAEIDGASKWKQFFKITVPLISPTTFYVLIMTTITTFQVFSQVYLMTGPPIGGPLGTTKVIVYYIFETGFVEGQNFLKPFLEL